MKNKKIGIIVVLVVFLIFIYVVVSISSKHDEESDHRDKVRGFWELEKYEVYEDGKLVFSEDKYKNLLVKFSDENIQFCYEIEEGNDCFSHNYWMKAGKLIIYLFENNIESEFTYTLDRDIFILRDGDDSNYTLSKFVKFGGL